MADAHDRPDDDRATGAGDEPPEELDLEREAAAEDAFGALAAQLAAQDDDGDAPVVRAGVPRQTAVGLVVTLRNDDPDAFRALLDGLGGHAADISAVALSLAEVASELLASCHGDELPQRLLRCRAAALNHRSPLAGALAGGLVEYMVFANTEPLGAGLLSEMVRIWLADDEDSMMLDVYEVMLSLALVCHQAVLDHCEERSIDPDKMLGDHALKIARRS